ncbi:hypothetical protein [Streptomyces sp. MI02-7b]|uniref:hypothetical protein n=1 Tax=Streptomyces sp. MI02-7b TaxID=462941 RepID=UPI0029A76CA6|nr:hypothetical protein [Streptomyces sp. MI02-7b]MDX3075582.1 hypothetical protein [Streptomyces sp. MI02-7b]
MDDPEAGAGIDDPETELISLPGPVFVDSSGRRARVVRRAGWAIGAACSLYTAALVLSLSGATPIAPKTLLPLPGVPSTAPDDGGSSGTGEVDVPADQAAPPAPAGLFRAGTDPAPSPSGGARPRASASPSPRTTPTGRATGSTGGTGPKASTSPTPRTTRTAPPAASPTPSASVSQSAGPSASSSPQPSGSSAPGPEVPPAGGSDQQPQGG